MSVPMLPVGELDTLWFQVGGTLCNLTCEHCFISCSPKNDTLALMSLEEMEPRLVEAAEMGVKEYYLTGGEPFIVKELERILERILEQGPVTVLTNGTLITPERARRCADVAAASPYSLELRVSIDGFNAEENDAIRGKGSFEKAMRAVERLVEVGFLPIITAAQVWEPEREQEVMEGFFKALRRRGYHRPRLKILPRLKIGAEEKRTGGYSDAERITEEMMVDFDPAHLLCHNSRMISARGVHVCPILADDPRGYMGRDLRRSLRPYPLSANACYTCWQYGTICSNMTPSDAAPGY